MSTSAEVAAAERAAVYARDRRRDAEHALDARRRLVASGQPAADAAAFAAALANPATVAALDAADAAAAALAEAEKALRACRSRGYRETDLAAGRRTLVMARRTLAAEATTRALYLCPRVRDGHGPLLYQLRARLREAEEQSTDAGPVRDLASAEARLATAEEDLARVRADLVPEATVAEHAAAIGPDGRKLIARLAAGYKPKPHTVAREPLYATLAGRGLVAHSASVTPLGREVVAWSAAHVQERVRFSRPLAPGVAAAFSVAERRAMAERARAALARGDSGLHEVGDPEAGYSYRLVADPDVLAWWIASMRLPKEVL